MRYNLHYFLPVFLAIYSVSCTDDPQRYENITHFVHTSLGSSSNGNQTDPTSRMVTSNYKPNKNQKHRSSDNFSTKGMNEGTHLLWCVPDGISFDIMYDKSGASDPTLASNVTNGALTQFSGSFKDTNRLYIANPKGATGNFQISYTVVNEDANDIYVCVAQDHSSGQSHRASSNFKLPRGRYEIQCPDGITFSLMEDKTAANDITQATELANGVIVQRPQATNIYISDPKGANGAFVVKFSLAPLTWVDRISDNVSITDISIPGTHDASTWLAGAGFDKCQNFDFTCQLDQGIRYFDMRVDGSLKLRHGSIVSYDYTFTQALKDMISWLNDNPKEMIMIQVKDDADGSKVCSAISRMLSDNPDINRAIFRENRFPKLGEIRGKLVMLRRFPLDNDAVKSEWGINVRDGWPDDTFCAVTIDGNNFYIEDRYFSINDAIHDTNKKKDLIKSSLDSINSGKFNDYLFLTFSSIACRVEEAKTPWDYAWGGTGINPAMNPALNDVLKDSNYKKTGVIIMDFYNKHGIDDPYKLVDQIVNRNF